MRVKCFSVRIKDSVRISDKSYKITTFDGRSAIIPSSQLYGNDYEVIKSDAYWISAWILKKRDIQYSDKKEAWFDSDTKKMLPTFIIEKHKPCLIKPLESNEILELRADKR